MNQTRTTIVNLKKLNASGEHGILIIRLMMACNDIALANQCLEVFKEEKAGIRKHISRGACMYFIRTQASHFKEGVKIIQEIQNNEHLSRRINFCSETAKDSLAHLNEYLEKESKYVEINRYIEQIRSQITFHYNEDESKLIKRALANRAKGVGAQTSTITYGNDISLFRFEVADDIIDSIVCRQILNVPEKEDSSGDVDKKEVDKIMVTISDLGKSFIEFSADYIVNFVKDYG